VNTDSLQISIDTLKSGDHTVLLYRDEQDWEFTLARFITSKLDQGALCICFLSGHTSDQLIGALRRHDIDAEPFLESGQLYIENAESTYMAGEDFSSASMIKRIRTIVREAKKERYPFVALCGETDWLSGSRKMAEEITAYEKQLNKEIFPILPFTALCQYNLNTISPALAKDVIRSHPYIIWKRQAHRNPYFIDTVQTPEASEDQIELENWLDHIRDLTSTEVYNLKHMLDQTILALAKATEKVDRYTSGHQVKVAKLSKEIAYRYGFPEEKQEAIWYAAMLHDVGKIAVPTEILNKKGKLYPHEWNLIRRHPRIGYDILHTIASEFPIDTYILQHHERLDGSGYPLGLTDGSILIESQIIAAADNMEAMTNDRPYRKALGLNTAVKELQASRGIKLHAEIVDICLEIFRENPHFLIMK